MGSRKISTEEGSPFAWVYSHQRREVGKFDPSPGASGRSTAETLRLYEIIQEVRKGLVRDYERIPELSPAMSAQKRGRWKPGQPKEVAAILGLAETTVRRIETVARALLERPELKNGGHHSQEEVMRLLKKAPAAGVKNIAKRERKVSDGAAIWRSVVQEVTRQLTVMDGAGGVAEVAKGWTQEQRTEFYKDMARLATRLLGFIDDLESAETPELLPAGRSQWDT